MTVYNLGPKDVAAMRRINSCSNIIVNQRLERIDNGGNVVEDLTDYLVIEDGDGGTVNNKVTHTCDNTAPGVYDFTISKALAWGRAVVRPVMSFVLMQDVVSDLKSPAKFFAGDEVRFMQGAYVASSPNQSLVVDDAYDVQAYDRVYLLMSDVGDTFSAIPDGTTTYAMRIAQLMNAAGIPNSLLNGKLNPATVDFPTSWSSKVIPNTVEVKVWPCDDSNNFQYIEIINQLLKASGCRPLFTNNQGRFVIREIVKPKDAPTLYVVDRSDDASILNDLSVDEGNTRNSDVWNIPNRIVYVQSGLTFEPIEGQGQYTINNRASDPAHYQQGSDQESIGRIIRSTRRLDASGQADLVKQAEIDFTDTYANAETFTLKLAAWPVAEHFDVFTLIDPLLPYSDERKVEMRSWEQPQDGSDMTMEVRTVAVV